jgi:dCTP deaminase
MIEVEPAPERIGPNSIDLHLGDTLKMYAPVEYSRPPRDWERPDVLNHRVKVRDPVNGATYYAIDPRNPPPLVDVPKLDDGRWLLVPGQFYIGVTKERTFTRGVVPHIDGRSTCGRLSIEAHKTAGVGDNGFNGRWTLEIEVTEPVLVSPGDRLFQVYFTPCWGEGIAMLLEAMLIQSLPVQWDHGSIGYINSGGKMPDGGWKHNGALLELHDLYGGEGHHYQGSDGARGAAPLDDG